MEAERLKVGLPGRMRERGGQIRGGGVVDRYENGASPLEVKALDHNYAPLSACGGRSWFSSLF
jgi:hypothetical protein